MARKPQNKMTDGRLNAGTFYGSRSGLIIMTLAAFSVMIAGCGRSGEIRSEVQSSRSRSYDSWMRERRATAEHEDVYAGKFSLAEIVDIGVVNNKDIASALQERQIASGQITEAYAQAYPRVDLEGRYTRIDETTSFAVDGGEVQIGELDNYSIGANLTQPLYRAGAIGAGIRAAEIYQQMSDEIIRGAVLNVVYEISRTYYDVLLAERLLEVAQENVALAEALAREVQLRRQQGLASELDVLRARVDVTNSMAVMIQTSNRLRLLRPRLYNQMGISQESDMELADILTVENIQPSLEEAVDLAFANRPELLRAEMQVLLFEQNVTATKAERWPSLDLFATYSFDKPDPRQFVGDGWGDAWAAGVLLRFPLFDGFRTRGRVRRAEADLDRSRIQLKSSEEMVLLNIRQALLSIQDAEAFLVSQEANIETASEGMKLVEAGYREGIATELEVRDARQALLRAEALHYEAIHQHRMAILEYRRATATLTKR